MPENQIPHDPTHIRDLYMDPDEMIGDHGDPTRKADILNHNLQGEIEDLTARLSELDEEAAAGRVDSGDLVRERVELGVEISKAKLILSGDLPPDIDRREADVQTDEDRLQAEAVELTLKLRVLQKEKAAAAAKLKEDPDHDMNRKIFTIADREVENTQKILESILEQVDPRSLPPLSSEEE